MTRFVLAGAAAGAMGWGIRGQYGHETGAMIAGLLVSLVIVQSVRPHAPAAWAMRAAAFGTIGVGFGGAMTYGQTIGLTQDAALVGNWAALRWGMLGLSVKGAMWIGFLGACLGMGLGSVRYRARELCLLMLALVAVAFAGMWLLNEPHDPARRVLPRLYFSASWYWRPDVADLQPRREVWGGLLLALTALGGYAGAVRRDQLALRLLGWGLLGGRSRLPARAEPAGVPRVEPRGLHARRLGRPGPARQLVECDGDDVRRRDGRRHRGRRLGQPRSRSPRRRRSRLTPTMPARPSTSAAGVRGSSGSDWRCTWRC